MMLVGLAVLLMAVAAYRMGTPAEQASAPGLATPEEPSTPRRAEDRPSEQITTAAFVAQDGWEGAHIRVMDEDHHLLAGAVAYVAPQGSRLVSVHPGDVLSATDGVIAVSQEVLVRSKGAPFCVSCPGYIRATLEGVESGQVYAVTLRSGEAIEIHFSSRSGGDLPGVLLRISRVAVSWSWESEAQNGDVALQGSGTAIYQTISDSNGRAMISGMPPGRYVCNIHHATHVSIERGRQFLVEIPTDPLEVELAEVHVAAAVTLPRDGLTDFEARMPPWVESSRRGMFDLNQSLMAVRKDLASRMDADLLVCMVPIESLAGTPMNMSAKFYRGGIERKILVPIVPLSSFKSPMEVDLSGVVPVARLVAVQARLPDGSTIADDTLLFYLQGETNTGRKVMAFPEGGQCALEPGRYRAYAANSTLLRKAVSREAFDVDSACKKVVVDINQMVTRVRVVVDAGDDVPLTHWSARIRDGEKVYGNFVAVNGEVVFFTASPAEYEIEMRVAGASAMHRTLRIDGRGGADHVVKYRVHVGQ